MSALTVALLAAQAELPTALRRDATNPDGNYRYMTLDVLISETRPILNAHGLTITQWPTTIQRGEHLVPGLLTRHRCRVGVIVRAYSARPNSYRFHVCTLCRETQADEDYIENRPEEREGFYARESDSDE